MIRVRRYALLVALVACADPADPPEPQPPTSFTFNVGPLVQVYEEELLEIGAREGDRTVATYLTWLSRDTTVATVSRGGTVRGVRPGETHVVASLGDLVDSVQVIVRTATLGEGQYRTQVRGDSELEAWGSTGALNDQWFDRPERNRGWFLSSHGDGHFLLMYPRLLHGGTVILAPTTVPVHELYSHIAPDVAFAVSHPGSGRLHVATGGRIVIETYDLPEGAVSGPVVGYVSAEARTYLYDEGPGPAVPTDERVRLFVEFRTAVFTIQVGTMTLRFDGGPYDGQEMTLASIVSREIDGPIEFGGSADYEEDQHQFLLRIQLEELHEGMIALGDPGPMWYEGASGGMPPAIAWFAHEGWPSTVSHATTGTIHVTEYRPPYRQGEHLFGGHLNGQLDMELVTVRVWGHGTPNEVIGPFRATATFDAAVQPWVGM